jgi:hypothetical protein
MCEFFQIFMNFVSSCARYVHEEPMCTGYALYRFSSGRQAKSILTQKPLHWFCENHEYR